MTTSTKHFWAIESFILLAFAILNAQYGVQEDFLPGLILTSALCAVIWFGVPLTNRLSQQVRGDYEPNPKHKAWSQLAMRVAKRYSHG
jgi:hypothetical protein